MKAVLLSIRPKWVELIASGKKTVEVRKTRPKIETTFKVYMYMTRIPWVFDILRAIGMHKTAAVLSHGFGKVVGEFVCDRIQTIYYDSDVRYGIAYPNEYCNGIAADTCLSLQEIKEYLTGKDGAGWQISDLVIYDEPKELSEFMKPCDFAASCGVCGHAKWLSGHRFDGCGLTVTRPPQSWCYVDGLNGNSDYEAGEGKNEADL